MVAGSVVLVSCNTPSNTKVTLKTSADSAAYAIGVDLGNNIKKKPSGSAGWQRS